MTPYEDAIEDMLPEGWELSDDQLICPHGNVLELDAPGCPDGCKNNPLRAMGII